MALAVTVQDLGQNAINALALGSLYALFALGIALIFGIMRLINFAHGELIMASAFALVLLADLPTPVKLVVALAVPAAIALALDRIAFLPVRGSDPATMLVVSFTVSVLLQNLANVVLGTTPRSTEVLGALSDAFTVIGLRVAALDIVTIAVTLVLLGALSVFLTRTSAGIWMRAAADDFEMSRLLGVRSNVVIALAFVLSGLLAGAAAVLLVAQTGSVTPTIGVSAVLFAFVATVVGGMGSLVGAVIGGFVLGVLSATLQAVLPVELRAFRDAFVFAAVFVVLFIRPNGLLVPAGQVARV